MVNYNAGFLSEEALDALGFQSLGRNVLVHQTVVLVGCAGISLGDNVRIDPFCLLSVSGGLSIGRNVHLGSHCSLTGSAPVIIGDYAGFSHGVRLFSASDDYSGAVLTNPTVPLLLRKVDAAPVTIGRHVIVGSNSVILPGSTINEGAATGAMCVVRGILEAWKVHAGPSTRAVRDRSRDLLALEAAHLATQKSTG